MNRPRAEASLAVALGAVLLLLPVPLHAQPPAAAAGELGWDQLKREWRKGEVAPEPLSLAEAAVAQFPLAQHPDMWQKLAPAYAILAKDAFNREDYGRVKALAEEVEGHAGGEQAMQPGVPMSESERRRAPALLLGVIVLAAAPNEQEPALAELPPPVKEAWDHLRTSFAGSEGMHPALMRASLKRNSSAIETLLTYADASSREADALASHLLQLLRAYAERFGPRTQLDDETVRATDRAFVVGTEPENGLNIGTYLLLEIAKRKGSAPFTRRALSSIREAALAHSRLALARTLLRGALSEDAIAREREELGGYATTLGGEIAWCCEQFMVDLYRSDEPRLPHAAVSVVQDYWEWRRDTLSECYITNCLHNYEQHRTMQWVKRLVDALPAAPEE